MDQYASGNPYASISLNSIREDDWRKLTSFAINDIIEDYLEQAQPDYIRLRWFYRRLAQVGHPGAISITLERLEELAPCFASVCMYISSLQSIEESQWQTIGIDLLNLLDSAHVKESE